MPNIGRRLSDRDQAWVKSTRAAQQLRNFPGFPAWTRQLLVGLLLSDLAAAAISAVLALFARFGEGPAREYFVLTLVFPLGWILLLFAHRAYESRWIGGGSEEFRQIFATALWYTAIMATTAYATKTNLARGYLFFALPATALLSIVFRYLLRRLLVRERRRGRCQRRVVVVGDELSAKHIVERVKREASAEFSVVGVCLPPASSVNAVSGVPVVGTLDTLLPALVATQADAVAVCAGPGVASHDVRRLCWQLEQSRVTVLVAPSITDIVGPRIHVRPVADLPLLHVELPEFSGARRLIKAVVDRVAAVAGMAVTLPVMLLVALAIRVDSRGPLLFRQVRVGAQGQNFTMYKFRSMFQNAETQLDDLQARNKCDDGLLFKVVNDPRVTRVGRFLRRFSLDELPQLLNVLMGQMSIVGPRPPLPSEVELYGGDVGRRLLVKPGLTGLWQINGRSELSWEESVRLDLHYVENWSLVLDFVIVLRTLGAALRGEGAH